MTLGNIQQEYDVLTESKKGLVNKKLDLIADIKKAKADLAAMRAEVAAVNSDMGRNGMASFIANVRNW